jgi:hypothetical protein
MSTATHVPTQRPAMNNKTLRPDLIEVLKDVLALRNYTRQNGGQFKTHKSERALLAPLNPRDLADVLRHLDEIEQLAKR